MKKVSVTRNELCTLETNVKGHLKKKKKLFIEFAILGIKKKNPDIILYAS